MDLQLLFSEISGPWSHVQAQLYGQVLSRILAISAIIVFVLLGSDLIVVDIIALQVAAFFISCVLL